MAYDEDLAWRVRAVLPPGEAVTERQMFGGLAFMLGGHMFCGVVRDSLMVRLGPEGADRALNQPHVRPMDFTPTPSGTRLRLVHRGLPPTRHPSTPPDGSISSAGSPGPQLARTPARIPGTRSPAPAADQDQTRNGHSARDHGTGVESDPAGHDGVPAERG